MSYDWSFMIYIVCQYIYSKIRIMYKIFTNFAHKKRQQIQFFMLARTHMETTYYFQVSKEAADWVLMKNLFEAIDFEQSYQYHQGLSVAICENWSQPPPLQPRANCSETESHMVWQH